LLGNKVPELFDADLSLADNVETEMASSRSICSFAKDNFLVLLAARRPGAPSPARSQPARRKFD
jgi:hypothetical protein